MASNKINYISRYNKETYKMYPFRVRKDNAEVISKLDNISNRNQYIMNLINEDIRSSGILTIKQIKQLIKPVIKRHNINDVYLFGSYARGEANGSSDIDFYMDGGDADTLWKLSALKTELKEALNKEVDVLIIGSDMDEYFKKQLEEDLIKIL